MPHDLPKNIDLFRQALEGARRPVAVFIGAGCPMSVKNTDGSGPLIPDIAGMTTILREKLEGSDSTKGAFAKLQAILEQDGKADADLEYMLSLVRALDDVVGQSEARGLDAGELKQLDEAISDEIVTLAKPLLPTRSTAYHRVMTWVGGIAREWPVEIFTTNYDMLAEQALEESGVPYFDGFAGSSRPVFDVRAIEEDALPARWARLWKLHGSVNWSRSEGGRVIRQPNANHDERRLIHPSHLKYDESRRMPYLALHDRLRQVLRQPNVVVVSCGYSFRDQHLNEIIKDGLQRNPSGIFYAFLYGELKQYETACNLSIDTATANLVLLAENEAVIGCEKDKWRELDDPDDDPGLPGVRVIENSPQCDLGDFAQLGQMLASLAGPVP